MPDDDLTFGQLRFRIGAAPRTVRGAIARLKIEPRRVGATTFYTREQADRIEAEHRSHHSNGKDLRKSRTIRAR